MSLFRISFVSARTTLIGCVWLIAVSAGAAALLRYERTPGETGAAITMWPEGSGLPRPSDRPTLLVFAHPKCPCTGATLGELDALLHDAEMKVAVTIIFSTPTGADSLSNDTALSRRAQTIGGVGVARDRDGIEAKRFGAKTSGITLLYSAGGKLLFHGGITDGRGHLGENIGRSAVAALLKGDRAETTATQVFGCPLFAAQ